MTGYYGTTALVGRKRKKEKDYGLFRVFFGKETRKDISYVWEMVFSGKNIKLGKYYSIFAKKHRLFCFHKVKLEMSALI